MAALVSVLVGGGMSLSLYQLRFSGHVIVASSLLYTVSCLHYYCLLIMRVMKAKGVKIVKWWSQSFRGSYGNVVYTN